MDIVWIIINIGLILGIACVVPSTQFKFTEIRDGYFKRVKIKKYMHFFRAIGGKSVKNHGLILVLFFEHLVGYLLSFVLAILSFCLVFAQGLEIIYLISTINIIMFLLHVIVFEILCVILIIISKHRKNKAIKEIVLSSSVKKKLQHFRDSKPPAAFQASERSAKFLEMFHIQVCPLLLEHEKISSAQCRKILDSYSKFLLQAGVEDFDEITLSYHKNIIEIMKIFQEFYC